MTDVIVILNDVEGRYWPTVEVDPYPKERATYAVWDSETKEVMFRSENEQEVRNMAKALNSGQELPEGLS